MDDFMFSLLIMLSLLSVAAYLLSLYRKYRLRHYSVPVRDPTKGHRFYMVDMFTAMTYCNVEECRLIHGAQCDTCGICVDDHNMKTANKKISCKVASSKNSVMTHHWVRGNLPACSECAVCEEECGVVLALIDLRCAWCKRTVHDDCAPKTVTCDLGTYQNFIVPPNCIEVKWVGVKGTRQRHQIVKNVCRPKIEKWTPLIVIANRKSGSNEGELLLRHFRDILNPAQVIDIQDVSPENALEWCNLLPDVTFRLLVCGGDGTIGWVLTAIEKLKLQNPPRLCILPLGTGNDLSRVLGWGEGYTGDVDVKEILNNVIKAHAVQLDRWTVDIRHEKHFGFARPSKTFIMNNYLSIGVDALVTLNFHKQRESWPSLFAHRIINKFCYFTYGTKDVLERECKHLEKKLKVELDGRQILLPALEGVVVLNISSWGGGCQPWGDASEEEGLSQPCYDDGVLEVMGLFSSFHIAQLQIGLATPLRLGQAKTVKISLQGSNAPMQVDGEPWEQHPAEIYVTHRGQAAMMALGIDGAGAGTSVG
ncbi:diacylglycerol kinase epsilon [Aplysia californica]|uniref:Diacylglycerol kinase n=1 Tax=Aplysia californica TaxID=6500 RepID=A0ABM0JVB2_APLCA|nr:diacylglycerol kinase epsilon [Aplysia californica]XP_035826686.1 diacylglycerol kinase epsilon [Aplysia californica]